MKYILINLAFDVIHDLCFVNGIMVQKHDCTDPFIDQYFVFTRCVLVS